jgi:hypothetical protein
MTRRARIAVVYYSATGNVHRFAYATTRGGALAIRSGGRPRSRGRSKVCRRRRSFHSAQLASELGERLLARALLQANSAQSSTTHASTSPTRMITSQGDEGHAPDMAIPKTLRMKAHERASRTIHQPRNSTTDARPRPLPS